MADQTIRRILRKMERRPLGWVDYSSDSYDYRVASARAFRIQQRIKGVRLTLAQAMAI